MNKPNIEKVQQANNETVSQRIAKLPISDQIKVLNISKKIVKMFERRVFLQRSPCCPQLNFKDACTLWPSPKQSNGLIPVETLDLALKWFQTGFKLQGFNYKVSNKTN